jgi:hypothetical protein
MPAVPTSTDTLLARLERARHLRPGARAAQRWLGQARRVAIGDAERLIRLHDAVMFLRAYPHSPRVLRLSEQILRGFSRRVARLADTDADLSPFDAPEAAGIAGTTVGTDFSFDVTRFLARRFGRRVKIDWDAAEMSDRMRTTWPVFLPLLEEEALADANVPYVAWLAAAAGSRRNDPRWLLDRYARLPFPEADRAEHFDALALPISWDLDDSPACRTRMRLPGPRPFFHDVPLLARRDVSLDRAFAEPRLELRRLSRRDGERLCDRVREATAARYREFYTFTYADPASVVSARPGRGVELFLVGVLPEKRLPLRSAYGGFVVKNGVPIGYIEGLAFAERLEIGFNMYYTFREGESAWIYAQVMRFHRDALGVTSFSIDPYQLGFENDEALDSGAFWFYRKLGFRPTHGSVRAVLEREEHRIARDPEYRSSRRTLERLVTHNLIYEVPGTGRGEWDRFHIRNLGLAVNRRMAAEYGGGAARLRAASERRVAAALGVSPARWPPERCRAFWELSLVLDLVPGLARWPRAERTAVADIIRAKTARTEAAYLRSLRRHTRLRRALIALGSSS